MHRTQADALKKGKRKIIYKVWSQLYDITPKLCQQLNRTQQDNEATDFLLKQTIKVAQEALEELERETKPNGGQ